MRRPVRSRAATALLVLCLFACRRENVPAPPPPAAAAVAEPAPPARDAEPPPVAPPPEAEVMQPGTRYTGDRQPPAGLPDDLPLYAGAIPIASMTSPDHGTIVNLRTGDAPQQVADWYAAELATRGWRIENKSDAGGQHLLIAAKSGRKASVLATTGSSGTQVLLTVLDDH